MTALAVILLQFSPLCLNIPALMVAVKRESSAKSVAAFLKRGHPIITRLCCCLLERRLSAGVARTIRTEQQSVGHLVIRGEQLKCVIYFKNRFMR